MEKKIEKLLALLEKMSEEEITQVLNMYLESVGKADG